MNAFRVAPVCLALIAAIVAIAFLVFSPSRERLEAARWTRVIPVPYREHAYRKMRPMVVRSEEQWRTFLDNLKSTDLLFLQMKEENIWDRWLEFEDAIRNARVDYPNEVLVLVPTKGRSGSKTLTPLPLRLASKRLRFDIVEYTPSMCTADSVCECFAFAVRADKADQFEFRINGTTSTLDLK